MSAVADLAGRSSRLGNNLLTGIFFVSPLLSCAIPRLTPLSFSLVALVLIGAALRRGLTWRELLPFNPALAACVLLVSYVLINASWAADHGAAFGKAALLAVLVIMTFAAATAAAALDAQSHRRAALAFAAGAFLGAGFLLFEVMSRALITRTIFSSLTFLPRPSPKHLWVSQSGEVLRLDMSKLNQNITLVVFHLWPGLLVLSTVAVNYRKLAAAVFFLTLAGAIAISLHGSSQIALAFSSLVFLLAWNWHAAVLRTLAVLWCAAFVLVIPTDFLAYRSELHLADWLPKSARARVILWEYTAERVLYHPWLGIGVESTPVVRDEEKATLPADQPEGFLIRRTTGQHAHDLFLQTWFELGAVGAVLLALAGTAVALVIPSLPAVAQPFASAAFATFMGVSAFAWGIWQGWFMCAIALLPLYLGIATRQVKKLETTKIGTA